MAEASDTLIQSLNTRISDLTLQVATLSTEAKKRRLELRAEQHAHAETKAAHATLATERDTWKGKAEADPPALQAKLDETLGQLRARDHRDAWREAVGAHLNDGATVEDIWAKIQYTPGEKIPTPAEITEQVKAAQSAAPYLFKPGSIPTNGQHRPTAGPITPPPLTAPIVPSRGAPDTAARRFEIRKSQSRDPAWMKQNYDAISEARQAGTLTFVDD
jgi:hypothetical protein